MMSYDRFEHEEALMSAWNAVEDFKLIAEAAAQGEHQNEEIAVMELGMSVTYGIKFDKLWSQFEQSIPQPKEVEDV